MIFTPKTRYNIDKLFLDSKLIRIEDGSGKMEVVNININF